MTRHDSEPDGRGAYAAFQDKFVATTAPGVTTVATIAGVQGNTAVLLVQAAEETLAQTATQQVHGPLSDVSTFLQSKSTPTRSPALHNSLCR